MAQSYGDVLEWIRLAEEAIKKRDYEVAAGFFRYATIYFGLVNDTSNQRKFAAKTGECYLHAAEKLGSENDPLVAMLLCVKAANCFQEGGSEELVRVCDSAIRQHYRSIAGDGFTRCHAEAHDLKSVGDHFVRNSDFERGIECYRAAAEKAFKDGKLALSGGLYRDIGDCYEKLKDFESAAGIYATAADMYSKGGEYFEAAWHYCQSGFLLIYLGRLEDASIMAKKASSTCDEGHIDVLLNDLSHVCRLLSERALHEAETYWRRIRRKFRSSYVNLIDSCFEALR